MGDVVQLQQTEMMLGAYSGAIRRSSAIGRGLKDMDHECEAPWENDVVGAQSELAVSKYTNLYWSGVTRDHKADVGDMIEVRHVTERHHRLIVRQRDEDHGNIDKPFVCVYAKDDKFEMMGWLFGVEVKVDRNEERPNGGSRCWMTGELHPMHRLKQWIEEQRKLLKT